MPLSGHDAMDQRGAARCCANSTAHQGLSRLGANAVLGTSLPMVNILSGGLHAGQGMDVQDFLAVPTAATSMLEAIQLTGEVRDAATAVCAERGPPTLLADEGGLSPGCRTGRDALDQRRPPRFPRDVN